MWRYRLIIQALIVYTWCNGTLAQQACITGNLDPECAVRPVQPKDCTLSGSGHAVFLLPENQDVSFTVGKLDVRDLVIVGIGGGGAGGGAAGFGGGGGG